MGGMDDIQHTTGCTATACRGECRVYTWTRILVTEPPLPLCQASPAYVPAYLYERPTRAQRLARDRETFARRRRAQEPAWKRPTDS